MSLLTGNTNLAKIPMDRYFEGGTESTDIWAYAHNDILIYEHING